MDRLEPSEISERLQYLGWRVALNGGRGSAPMLCAGFGARPGRVDNGEAIESQSTLMGKRNL